MIYGYIRVSTDKQDVDNQKLGINRKAAELGVTIDEWIADEGISGVKEYKIRQLGVLMDKLKDGDVVIVSEISRLARSVFMLFRIVEHCTQKIDAVIHAVKEGQTLKKNDVISAIILSAYGAAAQIEREMIVKRTTEALERRKAAGVMLGRPVGAKSEKLNEKHAKQVEEIVALNDKGVSISGIARVMGISRGTVWYLMKKYGVESKTWCKFVDRKPTQNILNTTKTGREGKRVTEIMNSERPWITEMICAGLTQKAIHEEVKKKYPEIKYSSVYRYINRDKILWDLLVEKNAAFRAVKNAGCSKNRYTH